MIADPGDCNCTPVGATSQEISLSSETEDGNSCGQSPTGKVLPPGRCGPQDEKRRLEQHFRWLPIRREPGRELVLQLRQFALQTGLALFPLFLLTGQPGVDHAISGIDPVLRILLRSADTDEQITQKDGNECIRSIQTAPLSSDRTEVGYDRGRLTR